MAGTLGQFMGVRENFHLNFICRRLCVFARLEIALPKYNSVVFDLAKKLLRGHHIMVFPGQILLNSLNFMLWLGSLKLSDFW